MTPPMTIAHSGGAEGGFGSEGAHRGAVHEPPLHPPPPGRPRDPDRTRTPGGSAPEGGQGREPRAAPQRGSREAAARPPPSRPPPPARKPRGRWPPSSEAGGMVPPPPAREKSRSTARGPAPAAGSHRNRGEQASPRQRARTPHRSRPAKADEHEPKWYGDHAPHDQNDASDTRFVACPGKAEGRNEAERPPALLAPPAAKTGAQRTGRVPPPKPAPRHTNARDPPHGWRTAPSTPDGARDRGRTRGGARTTWNGPTSAQCRDRARCTRHTTQVGGGRTPRERKRTHTQRARGDYQKGNRTELAYQRARVSDTRTGWPTTRSAGHGVREGENGRDTRPGTGPSPPNCQRALRTHRRGSAPTKAVVAHCATPQSLG